MNPSVQGVVRIVTSRTIVLDSIWYFLSMFGDFRKSDVDLSRDGSTQIRWHSKDNDGCDGLYVTR